MEGWDGLAQGDAYDTKKPPLSGGFFVSEALGVFVAYDGRQQSFAKWRGDCISDDPVAIQQAAGGGYPVGQALQAGTLAP